MRVDPDHKAKLLRSLRRHGDTVEVDLDIPFTLSAFRRLSLWERGLFTLALELASRAKRPTVEQRLILALFTASKEGDNV